jgi:hypothetical protein
VIFNREVKFDSKEEEGAVLIITDKGAFIGRGTRQDIVSSSGCFSLL